MSDVVQPTEWDSGRDLSLTTRQADDIAVKSYTYLRLAIVGLLLALGTAVSNARAPLMGILGFLAAPLAFTISRSLHQGAVKTLEIAGSGVEAPPVLLLALLKAIEYA